MTVATIRGLVRNKPAGPAEHQVIAPLAVDLQVVDSSVNHLVQLIRIDRGSPARAGTDLSACSPAVQADVQVEFRSLDQAAIGRISVLVQPLRQRFARRIATFEGSASMQTTLPFGPTSFEARTET